MIVIALFITAFVIGVRMGVVHERTRQQQREAEARQNLTNLMSMFEGPPGEGVSDDEDTCQCANCRLRRLLQGARGMEKPDDAES